MNAWVLSAASVHHYINQIQRNMAGKTTWIYTWYDSIMDISNKNKAGKNSRSFDIFDIFDIFDSFVSSRNDESCQGGSQAMAFCHKACAAAASNLLSQRSRKCCSLEVWRHLSTHARHARLQICVKVKSECGCIRKPGRADIAEFNIHGKPVK